MEIFKDIPRYGGLYQVSNLGRVKSLKFNKEKIMKQSFLLKNKNSYLVLNLNKDNKSKSWLVHRLVLLAFKGSSNLDVNHINGIKSDNRLENLEYCTRSENIKHAIYMGLSSNSIKQAIKNCAHYNNKRKTKILQFDLNKNLIQEYNSQSLASKLTNISQGNIWLCLNYKRKSAGGFIWRYV